MEIVLLALALLAAKRKDAGTLQELQPLAKFLQSGDLSDLTESEYSRNIRIGNMSGKQLGDALKALQKLARGSREDVLGMLAQAAGADLQGIGALAQLFAAQKISQTKEETADAPAPENPLAPVAAVADREIVYRLNLYFSEAG